MVPKSSNSFHQGKKAAGVESLKNSHLFLRTLLKALNAAIFAHSHPH
jgi:hypothetical protein